MMTDPNMVFSTDPRHGLVARSGWEQEVRTVLRDLGWEWAEELHALVPPDNVPQVDGVYVGLSLHAHCDIRRVPMGPRSEERFLSGTEPEAGKFHEGREAAPLPCVPVFEDRT